jgi:S1-C subfamily serine protease
MSIPRMQKGFHRTFPLPLLALAIATAACGGTERVAKAPPSEPGSAGSCASFGPLFDLRSDLLEGVPASTGAASQLANLDQQIAALELASERFSRSTGEASEVREKLTALTTALRTDRTKAETLIRALAQSYATVEASLDDISTCQGVDLRVLEAKPSASRIERSRAYIASSSIDAKAQRSKNKVVANSKSCAEHSRILTALASLDTHSKVSTLSVGQHLAEMTVDGALSERRDKLSHALRAHSKNLSAFSDFSTPKEARNAADTKIAVLVADLDSRGLRCIDSMREPPSQLVASGESPRRVTVLVRPVWPALRFSGNADEPTGTGAFGSGILVRWRLPSGKMETRVVSNAHVLDGAHDAEIFDPEAADAAEDKRRTTQDSVAERKKAREKTWKAKVVRISSDDDLAVMRVEEGTLAPQRGLTLRLQPPKEDEAVVAAGFPGIEARPSFQISRGTISNASFRSASGPFGGYLQHTAAIDPGNSGGPLLDTEGRLLGINTIKIMGRESVGFAIPAARVQLALLRADDKRRFLPGHASALCRAFTSAFSESSPHGGLVERLSVTLHEPEKTTTDALTVAYRDAVTFKAEGPLWNARLDAYARLRVRLEEEGGVRPLTECTGVRAIDSVPSNGKFEASFATRSGKHTLRIEEEEDGVLRVVLVK